MKFSGEKRDNIMFLSVEGNLDFKTHKEFDDRLNLVIEEGEKNILFDLSKLLYLSSCGLRVFLLYVRKIKKLGGQMVLFGLSDLVFEIFNVTGFCNIITICDTEEEALKYFSEV